MKQAQIDAKIISDIKKRIENQSATIDLVAKKAIEAEAQLDILDSTISLASNQIDTISELSNFVLMVTAAQNDNRYAFDSLKVLAEDINYPYYYLAWEAYISIRDNHDALSPFEYEGYIPWDTLRDPSKLMMNDLVEFYDRTFISYKPNIIKYIWERNDIPKIDRMDFLISIIKEDASLKAVERAAKYFSKESKQQYKLLATYRFVDWWEENREKYLMK